MNQRKSLRYHPDFINIVKNPVQTDWNSKNSRDNNLRSTNQACENSNLCQNTQTPKKSGYSQWRKDNRASHSILYDQFSNNYNNHDNLEKYQNTKYSCSFRLPKNDIYKKRFMLDNQEPNPTISNLSLSTPVKNPNFKYDFEQRSNAYDKSEINQREDCSLRQSLQKRIIDLQNLEIKREQESIFPIPNFEINHPQANNSDRIPGAPSSNKYEKRDQSNINISDVVECISFHKRSLYYKRARNI